MKFPIQASELLQWVPHRPPMLWIDEVIWVNSTEGECRLLLRPEGFYQGPMGIRPSSIIEWVAQSYALIRAAQNMMGLIFVAAKPKRVFLVAVKDARFQFSDSGVSLSTLKSGAIIRIVVKLDKILGPLSLVDGTVLSLTGGLIGNVKLKLYAE